MEINVDIQVTTNGLCNYDIQLNENESLQNLNQNYYQLIIKPFNIYVNFLSIK